MHVRKSFLLWKRKNQVFVDVVADKIYYSLCMKNTSEVI